MGLINLNCHINLYDGIADDFEELCEKHDLGIVSFDGRYRRGLNGDYGFYTDDLDIIVSCGNPKVSGKYLKENCSNEYDLCGTVDALVDNQMYTIIGIGTICILHGKLDHETNTINFYISVCEVGDAEVNMIMIEGGDIFFIEPEKLPSEIKILPDTKTIELILHELESKNYK